jgi:hypothetical protein
VQRGQQAARRVRDFHHRAIEGFGIGSRRPAEAGEFSDELQRRGADFIVGRRRFEIEQRLDVAAHCFLLRQTFRKSRCRSGA